MQFENLIDYDQKNYKSWNKDIIRDANPKTTLLVIEPILK